MMDEEDYRIYGWFTLLWMLIEATETRLTASQNSEYMMIIYLFQIYQSWYTIENLDIFAAYYSKKK